MTKENKKSDGRRLLAARISPELFNAIDRIATARGMTREALVTHGLALLFDELCEPLPETTRRQLERPFIDRRGKWKREPGYRAGD